jgi:hypothetical protein
MLMVGMPYVCLIDDTGPSLSTCLRQGVNGLAGKRLAANQHRRVSANYIIGAVASGRCGGSATGWQYGAPATVRMGELSSQPSVSKATSYRRGLFMGERESPRTMTQRATDRILDECHGLCVKPAPGWDPGGRRSVAANESGWMLAWQPCPWSGRLAAI